MTTQALDTAESGKMSKDKATQALDIEFSMAVSWALEKGLDPSELANAFEVSTNTVTRWANAVSFPHPKLQKLVLDHIEKLYPEDESDS